MVLNKQFNADISQRANTNYDLLYSNDQYDIFLEEMCFINSDRYRGENFNFISEEYNG